VIEPIVPDFGSRPYQIYEGDAMETLRRLAAGGVLFDCVVTSPPYYQQRRYGKDPRESGQEPDVSSFVASLVGLFGEVPLRPWANVWANIGDKRKDGALLAVPDRFFVAMRDAGFFLLDEVVWAKEVVLADGTSVGRCMTDPAGWRLNGNGWEPLFRFARHPGKAWSDVSAVRIPRDAKRFFHKGTEGMVGKDPKGGGGTGLPVEQHRYSASMRCVTSLEGRVPSSVWQIGTSRSGRGHFSSFPRELVERPVAMTCPEYLVDDGGEIRPRERIVEQTEYYEGPGKGKRIFGQYSLLNEHSGSPAPAGEGAEERDAATREKAGRADYARQYIPRYPKTLGWTHADKPLAGPGIVLDPFVGTGTTGEVAILLGRRFVGIDLYPESVSQATGRCEKAFEEFRSCMDGGRM